jgi:hypothetical protein
MNTLKLCIVTTMAAALLLGMVASVVPVVAQEKEVGFSTGQGPFDRSDEKCNSDDSLSCIVLQSHVSKVYTMGEVVSVDTSRNFSEISRLNGWIEGEVTLKTIIPKGKKFALYRKR